MFSFSDNSLQSYGLIKISGSNVKTFLQGQVTCDVTALNHLKGQLAAHCNPTGRVISLFYLLRYDDEYFLLLPRSMIERTTHALTKYAKFYRLSLENVTEDYFYLGVKDDGLAFENNMSISLPNQRRLIINKFSSTSSLPALSFLYSDLEWKIANLQSTIPTIHPETSEKFLPHELQLPQLNAISFSKGCYTGQEIIARMHYRGKLKTHLLKAITHHKCSLNQDIYCFDQSSWKVVGSVVDYISTPQQTLMLLLVNSNYINQKLSLSSDPAKDVSLLSNEEIKI